MQRNVEKVLEAVDPVRIVIQVHTIQQLIQPQYVPYRAHKYCIVYSVLRMWRQVLDVAVGAWQITLFKFFWQKNAEYPYGRDGIQAARGLKTNYSVMYV
jgi:hypothetical protein